MDIKFKDNNKLKLANFTQLEYIESTGTQYIDTGFVNSSSLTYDVYFTFSEGENVMFGSDDGNYYINAIEQSSTNINDIGYGYGANNAMGSPRLFNTKYHLHLQNGNQFLKNTVTDINVCQSTFSYSFTGSNHVLLCALNRGGYIHWFAKGRIYGCEIHNESVLVANFIPVKDINSVVCLYDTVSQTFFYNQGTGDFIAGPVVNSGLPETILLKTSSLFHKNTPNVDGLQLLNNILNYQKTHQEEIKEYYYPTTQLWKDIITEYPDILYWYNINHKFCVYICDNDDPEQCAEDFLSTIDDIQQELEDYPDLIPIIAEYPSIAPLIVEYPEVVHSLVDTGYETWLNNNGTAYLTTQLVFPSGIRLCGKFYFISLVDGNFISIAGTYNGKHNILRVNSGPTLQVSINSCNSSTDRLEYSITLNTKYNIDLSNRASAYIKNNGSIVASANFSGDIAPTPIALFAITRYDSSSDMQIGTLKSSAIKLYDSNDKLVLWLAPIQNNGNPCMIDLLTGTKYLNQGTGSFTYSLEPKNA